MSHPFTIFYSWQSDLPGSVTRNFIQDVFEKSEKQLAQLEVEVAFDRDTKGLSGSPAISDAIFKKIAEADAFVCDVSIINHHLKPEDENVDWRATPNPNVLIELGYAMNVLTWDRIILIVNEAYGPVELLPFDLKGRRITPYNLSKGEDKQEVRKRFVSVLSDAITQVHALGVRGETRETVKTLAEVAIEKLNDQKADAPRAVRSLWKHWIVELDALNPFFDSNNIDIATYEAQLREALEKSLNLTCEFGEVTTAIADGGNEAAAKIIYDGFSDIIERHENRNFGAYTNYDGDFFRFIGHEWFIMFVAAFVRAKSWAPLNEVLQENLVYKTIRSPVDRLVKWNFMYQHVQILLNGRDRTERLHSQLLMDRHRAESLEELTSWEEFWEADYFLFLYGQLNDPSWNTGSRGDSFWLMLTAMHTGEPASWVKRWESTRTVEKWLPAFNIDSVGELKARLNQRKDYLDPKRRFGITSAGQQIWSEQIAIVP